MGKNGEKSKENRDNNRFKRLRVIYSSESEDDVNRIENESSTRRNKSPPRRRRSTRAVSRTRSRSPMVIVHRDASPRRQRSPTRASSVRQHSPASVSSRDDSPPRVEPGTSTLPAENEKTVEEVTLDEDILMLLGDAPKDDTPMGPPIHKDIANRWQEILAKGLPKEVKDSLLKEYLVPSNCDLLLAPVLNPEAKAALSEVFVKRDSLLLNKQKQIGIAISALANVTQMLLSNETSKQKLLKPLSDACRILCDSHYLETKTRRNFVLSSTNTTLKDTLIDAKRNNFLFGDNVGEKLKIAKNIQRSGEVLKGQQKQTYTKNNFAYKKGRLNYKQTHRKTDNKQAGEAPRTTARPTQRQPPPRGNSSGTRKTTYHHSPQRRSYRR